MKVAHYQRIISCFLLLPREINGEVRWLERARIAQVYILYRYNAGWDDWAWVND